MNACCSSFLIDLRPKIQQMLEVWILILQRKRSWCNQPTIKKRVQILYDIMQQLQRIQQPNSCSILGSCPGLCSPSRLWYTVRRLKLCWRLWENVQFPFILWVWILLLVKFHHNLLPAHFSEMILLILICKWAASFHSCQAVNVCLAHIYYKNIHERSKQECPMIKTYSQFKESTRWRLLRSQTCHLSGDTWSL